MMLSSVNSKIYDPVIGFVKEPLTEIALPLKAEQENQHRFEILDINQPVFSQGDEKPEMPEAQTESEKAAALCMEKKVSGQCSTTPVSSLRSIAKAVSLIALGVFTVYIAGACLKGSLNPLDWVTRLEYWEERGRDYRVCVRTAPTWPWNNSPNDAYCQRDDIEILSGSPLALKKYEWGCIPVKPQNQSSFVNWIHDKACIGEALTRQKEFEGRLTPLYLSCSVHPTAKECGEIL